MNKLKYYMGYVLVLFLEGVDTFLHWTLDWYINRQWLGWGHLQLWQNNVCNLYERQWDVQEAKESNAK